MVGGYIYEVVEGWVAGVEGGEGDEVGWEVIVAWDEGEMNHRAESKFIQMAIPTFH